MNEYRYSQNILFLKTAEEEIDLNILKNALSINMREGVLLYGFH